MSWIEKTIVALDNMSLDHAEKIIANHSTNVHGFKMNHTMYPYIDKSALNTFADYKLYDIPNTVCSVVEHLIGSGANMVTINMMNDRETLWELKKYSTRIKLLGVSVLTSWTASDCDEILRRPIEDVFERNVDLMENFGFWGMICAVPDLKYRAISNTKLKKICPGIRMKLKSETGYLKYDDQQRTASPDEAVDEGADYIVMGRSFFEHMNK